MLQENMLHILLFCCTNISRQEGDCEDSKVIAVAKGVKLLILGCKVLYSRVWKRQLVLEVWE
jgi:hypothetical protein